ncbi:MAG: disulfide oxidoreductase YuzD [Candidatus Azotimanducaceae bacterium]
MFRSAQAAQSIQRQYPRHDFKNAFVDLVMEQAEMKPQSHIATRTQLGFGTKAKKVYSLIRHKMTVQMSLPS